ncbi:hypothetical protein KCU90_g193, partial [Aureobasidium melanogenum]
MYKDNVNPASPSHLPKKTLLNHSSDNLPNSTSRRSRTSRRRMHRNIPPIRKCPKKGFASEEEVTAEEGFDFAEAEEENRKSLMIWRSSASLLVVWARR